MKARTNFSFVTQEPGNYLVDIKSLEWSENDDKETICTIKNKVLDSIENGSEFNDSEITEWLNMTKEPYNKSNGGRLLGLMLLLVPKFPDKDYPEDYFNDTGVQAKVKKSLEGQQYGMRITQKVSKNKKGEDSTFIRVQEYFDKSEYQNRMRASSGKSVPQTAPAAADNGKGEDSGW